MLDPSQAGCDGCCNDGEKISECLDVEACAAKGPKEGKYAFVLTHTEGPGHNFLPYLDSMKAQALAGAPNVIDILLLMKRSDSRFLRLQHRQWMKAHGVRLLDVDWDVPPDAKYHPVKNWCGTKDFIRLHALALEGYDAIAYYDSDIEFQGDVMSVFRCAATGRFLSTNGGIGEALNVGFFALRPDPRFLQAARIFSRVANFTKPTGWGECGFAPNGGKYVGAECGQGFFHTLFYKRKCKLARWALAEAGLDAPGALQVAQLDRCVWNYQTSFQCKKDFDCKRVRVHHKPPARRGSNPNECVKSALQ